MTAKYCARVLIGGLATLAAARNADAYEFGGPTWLTQPGITLGPGASMPAPGVYMFDQVVTTQSKTTGTGPLSNTSVHVGMEINGFLFVPGWTFLGATYDALIVQPFVMADVGSPINANPAGIYNTLIIPAELSWNLGGGFHVLAGLDLWAPTGNITGPNGLGSTGTPWWTFQPDLKLSYLKDGWNATANLFVEINTRNSITGYRSGDVFHADLTLTKTIGKWTVGPVAFYAGQVTDDKSSAFYGGAINVNRYNVWGAGGLLGYDFGHAALTVWAVDTLSAHDGGSTIPNTEILPITKGWAAFATLSYRLWAPEGEADRSRVPSFITK